MEGIKEAIAYITGLAVKAEKPETIEINGRTYCTKDLRRYDVLALVAALLLFGVIGEKDGLRQQNITIAFAAVIVLIISLNRFF